MKKVLFLSVFALCASPASAADPAQCDSTAFTLAKPSAPAPKTVKAEPVVKQAPVPPAPKQAAAKSKTSSRLVSTCKDGKTKKRG